MTTDNFCFYLQNRLIQTSQTGGQWYSDTSPFSIPWLGTTCHMNKCHKRGLPILYFIENNAHTSIVRTWISQWFLAKKLFLFFKNNFTIFNHWKFIYHKSHLKPFLSYLPCIVPREYFSIIFNVKKCALYSIKYSNKFDLFWKRTLILYISSIIEKPWHGNTHIS